MKTITALAAFGLVAMCTAEAQANAWEVNKGSLHSTIHVTYDPFVVHYQYALYNDMNTCKQSMEMSREMLNTIHYNVRTTKNGMFWTQPHISDPNISVQTTCFDIWEDLTRPRPAPLPAKDFLGNPVKKP